MKKKRSKVIVPVAVVLAIALFAGGSPSSVTDDVASSQLAQTGIERGAVIFKRGRKPRAG